MFKPNVLFTETHTATHKQIHYKQFHYIREKKHRFPFFNSNKTWKQHLKLQTKNKTEERNYANNIKTRQIDDRN